jgi:hypothetical protein
MAIVSFSEYSYGPSFLVDEGAGIVLLTISGKD